MLLCLSVVMSKICSYVIMSFSLLCLKYVLMSEKKTKNFILRIDSDTMDAIEAWAADEFRSTNGQLQWIITEALRKAKRLPKKKMGNADELKDFRSTK